MATQTYNDFIVATGQTFVSDGTHDDVEVISTSMVVLPTNDGDTITGFQPPIELTGGLLFVANGDSGSNRIILPNNDSGSTDIYRLYYPEEATELILQPGQFGIFTYVEAEGWRFQRPGALTLTNPIERRCFTQDFTANFGSITALLGTVKTVAVSGVRTTDHVLVQCLSSLSGAAIATAWVSAANTISIHFVTAVALGVTLGSLNFRVTIFR